jgi:hypothetical protein
MEGRNDDSRWRSQTDRVGTIIYWSLLDLSLDRRYECHWVWQRAAEI